MTAFLAHKALGQLSAIALLALVFSGRIIDAQGPQAVPGLPLITFVVDSTADDVDVTPKDQKCATASGECTLRAAIQQANAHGGNAYTIILPRGSYSLTLMNPAPVRQDAAPSEEDAALTGDLDITGRVTIVGAGPAWTIVDANSVDRVFDVRNGGTVTLMGITIRGGCVGPPLNSSVAACSGASWSGGGGIRNAGILSLVNAHVRENRIVSTAQGAGILNSGPSEQLRSRLTIAFSAVARNTGSRSSSGGGISTDRGETVISETDIVANSADDSGGGILNAGESAGLVVTDSLIRENEANRGGGIFIRGTATLTNVTLSRNGARFCEGAAVYNVQGTTLTSSTVTGSTFGTCTAGNPSAALFLFGPLILRNTIVAEEYGCVMNANVSVQSQGYNLDQRDSCNLRGSNDLRNADPKLDSLSSNGGLTLTHRLLTGSQALDAIQRGGGNDSPATDQRGAARPFGSGFDIGAFEGPDSTDLSPLITRLEPDAVPFQEIRQAGLRVFGTGFTAGMRVVLGGMLRAAGKEVIETSEILETRYVGPTELSVNLEQRHTARPGMLWVRIVNTSGVSSSNLMRLYAYQTR